MDAAARLKNHQDIYAPPYYHIYFQYFYSPLFALILLPFTFLPFSVFETLWVMFMFFCLYDIWKMSKEYFDTRNFSNQKNLVWLFGTLFFILSFILYNISQIQMTVFLLWATLCSLKMFDKKRFLPGGILLGLVINIKIMPIIFLPYLIYRNQWRAAACTMIFFFVFIYIPAIFIGWQYNQELLHSWWSSINPANSQYSIETSRLLVSLNSTIPVFLTETKGEMNLRRNIVNLDYRTAILITNIIRIGLVLLSLAFFRTKPFVKMNDKTRVYWETSYLFLLTPLIFPHQNKYAYFYLLPAFTYLCYYIITNWKKVNKAFFCIILIISFIYTPFIGTDIIGHFLFDLLQYYRIQVLCTLLLIPVLLFYSPDKLASRRSPK